MKSDYSKIDKVEFQKIISESSSICDILRKLGLKPSGSNHTKLSKFLKESDFDTTTLLGRRIKRYNNTGIPHKPLSEILCENSTGNSTQLKKRLLRYGIKEYKCENPDCGISEWHGNPIQLELHHINGNHYDNRLENLVLLCPNCHSQTENFRGKNSRDNINDKLSIIAKNKAVSEMDKLIDMEKTQQSHPVVERKVETKRFCLYCGKEIKRNAEKFCSVECSLKYHESLKGNTIEEIIKQAHNYSSLSALSRHFNLTDNAIRNKLVRHNKLDEVEKILDANKKQRAVLQFDINGTFLKKWKNSREASEILHINKTHINNCCNGNQKTCGGFIWKYPDNYTKN